MKKELIVNGLLLAFYIIEYKDGQIVIYFKNLIINNSTQDQKNALDNILINVISVVEKKPIDVVRPLL